MRNFWTTILLLAALLVPATAFAQSPSSQRQVVEEKRRATEEQARQTIEGLFSRLCPGRCELVELRVEMKDPRPAGDVLPGFESVATPGAWHVEAQRIHVTVLLDSKLPRNFQSNVPRMLQYRLANLAPTVEVRPEVLDFPEPQLQPLPPLMPEPPRRAPEPLPAPAPVEEPPAASAPVPEPVAEEAPAQSAFSAFLEALKPWIGPLLMTLLLFAILLVLLRKLSELNKATAAESAGAASRKTDLDPEGLRAELNESRALRNQVLRKWLKDSPEDVALLVSWLGASIISDLKSDPIMAPQLKAVSEIVGQQPELPDEETLRQLAQNLKARITAAKITLDDQGMAKDWEFLQGVTLTQLRRIFSRLSINEKTFVIGQLPSALRASYLETLNAEERKALFLGSSAQSLSKDEAMDLAARVRKDADEFAHIGKEADGQATLVLEMLRALALDEQEETLRELRAKRPEVASVVLENMVLETTCLQLPPELIADAIHRTPVEIVVAFMRGTRPDVRDHLIQATPSSRRNAVLSELSLDVPVGKAEFLEARERFTSQLADVLKRDGHELQRTNSRALMRGPKINPVEPNEAMS